MARASASDPVATTTLIGDLLFTCANIFGWLTKRLRMMTFESHSAAETVAFGERMAHDLEPGDAVALHGELGAGKTCLVKGIARGLGITQDVTSPTFTIVHEYRGGRLPLVHVDLYRLDTPQDAAEIGIEDYFCGEVVTVIEWAEKIAPLLPQRAIHVRMELRGENERTIVVS